MLIKVRAKPHPFRDGYDEFYREAAPLSAIFAGLNSPLDISHARFLIDDEMVTDAGRVPPEGSTVYVIVVPQGGGTSTENAGKGGLILGFLAILGGITTLALIGWTGVGGAAAGMLIGTGVGMMLGGAVLIN